MTTPLFRPQILQKGDGSLHLQLSLGELCAELPVPEKYKDPQSEGWMEFYKTATSEMMRGLKVLHKNNQVKLKQERKLRNGYQNKRADYNGTAKEDDGANASPSDPRRV